MIAQLEVALKDTWKEKSSYCKVANRALGQWFYIEGVITFGVLFYAAIDN